MPSTRAPLTPDERVEAVELIEDQKDIRRKMPSIVTYPADHHEGWMRLLGNETRLQQLLPANTESL